MVIDVCYIKLEIKTPFEVQNMKNRGLYSHWDKSKLSSMLRISS